MLISDRKFCRPEVTSAFRITAFRSLKLIVNTLTFMFAGAYIASEIIYAGNRGFVYVNTALYRVWMLKY